MKTRLPVQWNEDETPHRLSYVPLAPRALPAECWTKLEGFKRTFATRLTRELAASLPESLLHRAIADAWSLAALTLFPHLFLPALAEEKVAAAQVWFTRQQRIANRETISLSA